MAKQWPKNDKPSDYDKIVRPLIRFGRQILKDKNFRKVVKFTGYREGRHTYVTCPDGDYWSHPKHRKQCFEDQGRDQLETLLGIVFRAGIEQGRRLTIKDIKSAF